MFIKELQQGHAAQLKTPQIWVLGDFFPYVIFKNTAHVVEKKENKQKAERYF